MNILVILFVVVSISTTVSSQYEQGRRNIHNLNSQYQQPPASILLHKQALGKDGSFNYAFAADNGLQQGEVIDPEGNRRGSFSYVDPNGKTVSLSYTAGKDGFRVLSGDHVPKVPLPQQQQQLQLQQQQLQQQHHGYPQEPYLPIQQQQIQQQQFLQQQHRQPYQGSNQQYSLQPQHFNSNPTPYGNNGIPYEAYKQMAGAPVYRGEGTPYRMAERNDISLIPPHAGLQAYGIDQEFDFRRPEMHKRIPHYTPRQYRVQQENYDKPYPYVNQNNRPEEEFKPHSFGDGFSFQFAGK